jgi:hypothetical protein
VGLRLAATYLAANGKSPSVTLVRSLEACEVSGGPRACHTEGLPNGIGAGSNIASIRRVHAQNNPQSLDRQANPLGSLADFSTQGLVGGCESLKCCHINSYFNDLASAGTWPQVECSKRSST